MFDELRYYARGGLALGLAVAGIIILLGLAASGIVGLIYWKSDGGRPPSPQSLNIPYSKYGEGVVQALDCVRQGPERCRDYDLSIASFMLSRSITYPSATPSDPGEDVGGGRKRFQPTKITTRAEWAAFASACTLGGEVNPATAPASAFSSLPLGSDSGVASLRVASGKTISYKVSIGESATLDEVSLNG